MNILCIASDVGKSAAGIVFDTIIRELAKYNEISLISPEIKRMIKQSSIKILETVPSGFRHYKLDIYSMSLLGFNIFDYKWVAFQKRIIRDKDIENVDVIMSFASNCNYKEVMLGAYLARKYNKKWVIYSVDAIPAPMEWLPRKKLYKNTSKFISKYISKCDGFFSANKQMLDYQLREIGDYQGCKGVMLTPMRENYKPNNIKNNSETIFLYTGYLYGPRKIDSLMQGFKKYLKRKPKAKIIFIGQNNTTYFNPYMDLLESKNVEVVGFTENLTMYYDNATALLDINSVFDNDVYLSSKIANYLSLNKPIIAISGLNSPIRNIFTEDDSIIHCLHEVDDIYNAMLKVDQIEKVNFGKRNAYVEMFSAENIIGEFNKILHLIVRG